MPLGIWDPEWLSANSQRNYPLSESATGKDTTGAFVLPPDVLTSLIWSTHESDTTDSTKFHLSNVVVLSGSIILGFGYDGTTIATVTVLNSTHTENTLYKMVGSGADFFDSVIKITVGKLDNVLQQPAGSWTFDVAGGRLEPTVIRPDVRSISSVVIKNQQSTSAPIQDEIELAAGSNIKLTVSTVAGVQQVRIDAISGEGLIDSCECAGQSSGTPIRTINNIGPDTSGNFTLLGDACLQLTAIANGQQLTDSCAQPCCGCAELEVITQATQTIQNKLSSLDNYSQQLGAVIQQLQNTILVSKIGAPGNCP